MARYWIDFKKLREELSFEKVFEHYSVKLHKKGEQATGPCPLPNHTGERKTDSFSANVPKRIFQCFSCHATGNILDFAVLMEKRNPENGNDLRQTAIELAKRYGLQNVGSEQKSRTTGPNGVSYARQSERQQQPGTGKASEPAKASEQAPRGATYINTTLPFTLRDLDPKHPYLRDRGLTPETIGKFGLGFCRNGRLTGRIAIPIHNLEGNLIAYAGRFVDESAITAQNPKYLFPGTRVYRGDNYEFRKSWVLYNAHRLNHSVTNLIIVEGFASVWWLTQNGFPNCVALMGSSLSVEQVGQIGSFVGQAGHVTAFTDADVPGMRCCDEIRAKLGEGITIVRPNMPVGSQPTDFTKAQLEALIAVPEHDENNQSDPTPQSKEENICKLIASFPCLANVGITSKTWDPKEFDKATSKLSSGERVVAQFILSVWNRQTKWKCGRFDAVEAAAKLDHANMQPISRWLQQPWWP
jgi:DNA primase